MNANLIPTWIPDYERSWFRSDVIAGLTVAALVVPEGMAYAQIAGVPPETAFYAAPMGLLMYALLGSSRQLVVAVSGAVSVMSATIVGQMTDSGSEEFIALTAALAIVAGLISIAAGFLKLGRIAQFFSESVLTGFVFGLALVIAVKQLPKIMGIEGEEGNFFERLWHVFTNVGDANSRSVVIGVTTIVLMVVLEKYFESIPAALVALIGGILVGEIFNVAEKVEVIGEVPAGIVGPAIPNITTDDIQMLVVGGLAITLVSFAEAIGPARGFASEHEYEMDDNQELIGLGGANLGAGLFQGFSVGSSLSKSAANDRAGAKTPLSLIVASLMTVLVALFLTGTLENLPEPTLGAIVIVAVSGMMKIPAMQRLWNLNKRDFTFAATALAGVLLFDALPGLGIAVLVSLGAVIWRAATPSIEEIGRKAGSIEFVDVAEYPDAKTLQGLVLIRLKENLFFANAASIRSGVKELAKSHDPPPSTILLDLQATVDVDVPSCDELKELAEELKTDGITLALTRVQAVVMEMFEKTGVVEAVGADEIYLRNVDAIAEHASRLGVNPDPDDFAAGTATGLDELARLTSDAELEARLRRAAQVLRAEPND